MANIEEFDEPSNFPDYYYITEGKEQQMSFTDLCKLCIWPTIYDTSAHIGQIFICCLIFRIVSQYVPASMRWKHCLSVTLGLYILNYYFKMLFIHIVITAVVSYVILLLPRRRKGPIALCSTIIYLTINEIFNKHEDWSRIRSAEMLIGMKFISIAFDIGNSGRKPTPELIEYLGYVLCCGSCIFGPWMSYGEYMMLYQKTGITFKWLRKLLYTMSLTVIFFVLSTCLVEWLIPDTSNRLLILYRDALIFRCGHYFVSFLSDTTTGLMGAGCTARPWDTISHPSYIEIPRSLVQVCIHWNLSMHRWFKLYVFRPIRPYGAFPSILLTYLVSALLHGLNHRLSAVLLSLGFYTFVEQMLRSKLAEKFDACISARSCPYPCHMHRNMYHHSVVLFFNYICGLLAMFHLAYLGALMDTSDTVVVSIDDAFDRWSEFYFVSHWIVACTYIVYFFV